MSGCVRGVVSFIDRAAWRDNVDIGDTQLLKQLLDSNGFDGSRLLEEANTQPIKRMLFRNNERLVGRYIISSLLSAISVTNRVIHLWLHNLILFYPHTIAAL